MTSPAPANPKNIFSVGHARFTVLTSRLLRLEWVADGNFEDRSTMTVNNRWTKTVDFSVKQTAKKLTLTTSDLTLTYQPNGKPFSKANLEIRLTLKGKSIRWWPGKSDSKNLQGTARTLDGVNGSKEKKWVTPENLDPKKDVLQRSGHGWCWQGEWKELTLSEGLISRNGCAVVDDSTSVVLDSSLCDWQPWVRERPPGKRQDLYFLGYGHDYKDALKESQQLFGSQPLPPRYVLGYWYSRYWAYTDKELKQLVTDYEQCGLPLDVLVIDMDWHKMGWTGYSWDPDYFPDPEGLLKWLRKKGLKITLNLHPADGVFDFEDAFPDMLKTMGLQKKELPDLEPRHHALYKLLGLHPETAKRIPLNICDPEYMRAYFKCLHHPLEKMGVDFWWMDWQQGSQGSHLPHLDTLPWINELHWQDQVRNRKTKRPLNFSRFGGVGAGRMPVGFSGDTYINWDSLAYQPYFTATASNVLYGTWSHDIGGHMSGTLTPELYTRWIQFGVYSPILRTHASKSPESERRVFHYPEPYRRIMSNDCKRRYQLVPYIYTQMRNAVDTGISLCRPLYYEWPEENQAYTFRNQYMFGDEMLVAPVVRPVDESTEMTDMSVWLPQGEWWDTAWGSPVQGGGVVKRSYVLEETPVFVRPGTVIPEQQQTSRLKKGSYPSLVFRIYSGKAGSGTVYEDDGENNEWKNGKAAEIRCDHEKKGSVRTIRIHPATGSFSTFRAKRPVQVILEGVAPPKDVAGTNWTYDGDTCSLQLDLGKVDLTQGVELKVRDAGSALQKRGYGLKGLMTRLEKVRALNCLVSPAHPVHGEERLAVEAAQTGNRIGLKPDTFSKECRQLEEILQRLPTSLRQYQDAFTDQKSGGLTKNAETLLRARNILTATLKDLQRL